MKIVNMSLKIAGLVATLLMPISAFSQVIFDNYDLCKAAISSEMGRSVKSMKSLQSTPSSPEISYVRAEDGNKYRYNCKIEGGRIIWRAYFNDSVQVGWGRWRNEPGDSIITYSIKDTTLTVSNSFGDITEKFQKKDF